MSRSLSALESRLILFLEWNKQPFVTTKQVMDALSISNNYARVMLHRLVKKGWLAKIVPGVYELIPADRGESGFTDTNPLALGSVLANPYAFSFSTAAYYYGLSTQAPATVYLETPHGKTRNAHVRGRQYRVIAIPENLFFAVREVDAYGSRVQMVEVEKAILDCFAYPDTAEDIPEIAAMLWHGKNRLDWQKMAAYALRYHSKSLVQRLGYLTDYMKIDFPTQDRQTLFNQIGNNVCYLGGVAKWGEGGKRDPTWQVVVNIPESELRSEIQVS